jgi:hypothetical protein
VRVTGTIFCLLVALGLGPAAAAAQPDGRLDDGQWITRAPGTVVARFDETRVRAELGTDVRLVVLPYVDYEHYLLDHRLPADLAELRTTVSTRVITERLVVFARLGGGRKNRTPPRTSSTTTGPGAGAPDRVAT